MKLASLFFLFPIILFAQSKEVRGTVYGNNGEKLAFCTIGVLNKGVGTISDVTGNFVLSLPNDLLSDTLTFSYVGYESAQYPIQSLLNNPQNRLVLKESAIALDEVEVRAKKLKSIEVGYKKLSDLFLWIKGQGNGAELATYIPLSKKIFLDEIDVQIQNEDGKEFKLLLNVYEVDPKTKKPGKQLLKKRKLILSSQKKGWLNVDISDQNIMGDKPIFIGLKWIDIENEVPFLGMNVKTEKSYLRTVALGEWNIYLNANVKVTGSVIK